MTNFVHIVEVGARDGLQNEKTMIATGDKIRLIDLLSATGLTRIEATSFVSPKWVPQMGDAAEVLTGIKRVPGVRYLALTPNLQGFEDARRYRADEVAVFAAASEAFSRKNINCTVAESLERFKPVVQNAHQHGIPVRGYVSCVAGCPYQGTVPPDDVARVTESLFQMGCYEVSLGDTIGAGNPEKIQAMLSSVLDLAPPDALAGHFHDTAGNAVANIGAALAMGLRIFDTSVAGLGGCPYAPGAQGNAATGTVVSWLHRHGYQTGIDMTKLLDAENFAAGICPGRRSNGCNGKP